MSVSHSVPPAMSSPVPPDPDPAEPSPVPVGQSVSLWGITQLPPDATFRTDGGDGAYVDAVLVRFAMDPLRARNGFEVASEYVEKWWISLIGPSSVAVLRFCAREIPLDGNYHRVESKEFARRLGLAAKGRRSSLFKTLERLAHFGFIAFDHLDATTLSITVWTHCPGVPPGSSRRWSRAAQREHFDVMAARAGRNPPTSPQPIRPPTEPHDGPGVGQ